VTAYILALNKIIGDNDLMNAQTFAKGAHAQPRRLRKPIS